MGVEGWKKATILSSIPLGCLASPIVCMIADRHFASQRVLTFLNIACAVLFFAAAQVTSPLLLFIVLLFAMFCYMPTWSLTSAIAMANSPSEKFPQIRALGSIGWVAALLFSVVAWKVFDTKIDGTKIPLICGSCTAVIAAILNLSLPNTPPPAKGQKTSIIDALGLRAIVLMKDPNFVIFIILSMLVMIPFTMYFALGSEFLQNQGFKLVTATMNTGQFVEMFLMLLIPIALARLSIKWTMTVGLVGLVVRYLAFWAGGVYGQIWLYFLAILIHGLIFGFFFVGGQVYVDKKAPKEIQAQAQGLMFLVTFGVGWLVGNFFNVKLIEVYTTQDLVAGELTKVYNWNMVWIVTTAISVILLAAFVLLFRDKLDQQGEAVEPVQPEPEPQLQASKQLGDE
jgi:nucleoside transporter